MKSILLIEDDPLLIDLYATKLREAEFEVEIAANGQEGLKKVKTKKPDLLILDIVLPAVNGWEILEEIKKIEGLQDLKIVIFSNFTSKEEVEKGLSLGAVKYLIKSHYTPSEVVREIKKILE